MTAQLPTGSHVWLSEAVSWIAFGKPMRGGLLVGHLMSYLNTNEYDAVFAALEAATNALADAGHAGKIVFEGLHQPTGHSSSSAAPNQQISTTHLRDYRQLDIALDALRFGQGLAWMPNAKGSWVYAPNARPDHFVKVIVNRRSLMTQFAPVRGRPAGTLISALPDLSDADLRKWWEALDEHERALPRENLLERCASAHPNHKVTRERIRKLTPGRRPGPRKIQP